MAANLRHIADQIEAEFVELRAYRSNGEKGESYISGISPRDLAISHAHALARTGWTCTIDPADPHDTDTPRITVAPR